MAPISAFAQETLDPIYVIADEIVSTGDVEHSEFTGSHQRIETLELVRRDVTLADVLAHETGVQSRQVGGYGTFSSITVRAATAAQTGVFLDGILLNGGGNAVIDLSMLELFNVGAIDIYRGSTPLQLSHASIGGAINLTTLPATQDPETRVLLGGGSFGTERLQLSHSRTHEDWDVLGGISVQHSDNNFAFLETNGTPLNGQDDTHQRRNNAQVRRTSGLFRAGFQWSETQRSDLLVQATAREQGVPEWRNNASNQASFDSDAWRIQWNQTIDGLFDWNTRHTLFAHRDSDHFDDRLSQVGLNAQDTHSVSDVLGVKTYWEHIGDTHTTGVSAELRHESLDADDRLDANANRYARRNSLSATVQSHRFLVNDRLLLSPALRLQVSDNTFERRQGHGALSSDDAVFSPQLGFQYQLTPTATLRANAGRFYREPSFNELFGSTGLIRGNRDLESETGSNGDLGINWIVSSRLTVDASLFASWRDELIATVYDARGVGRAINVGQARIVGIEFGTDWQLGKAWLARINFTAQDARSLQTFAAFNDKQLPGQAQRTVYARVQYSENPWRAYLEATGAWNRFYDQANVLPAQDQWLQNLGIEWRRGDWSATAAVNNITNRQVEDFNGFPRPGRSFTFSLSRNL